MRAIHFKNDDDGNILLSILLVITTILLAAALGAVVLAHTSTVSQESAETRSAAALDTGLAVAAQQIRKLDLNACSAADSQPNDWQPGANGTGVYRWWLDRTNWNNNEVKTVVESQSGTPWFHETKTATQTWQWNVAKSKWVPTVRDGNAQNPYPNSPPNSVVEVEKPWVTLGNEITSLVAATSDGILYFAYQQDKIGRVLPDGTLTMAWASVPREGWDSIESLFVSSNNDLYAVVRVGSNSGHIYKVSPTGEAVLSATTMEITSGLTEDPYGNLYFTASQSFPNGPNYIAKVTQAGTVDNEWLEVNHYGGGLVSDSYGNLYTSKDPYGNGMLKITPDKHITEIADDAPFSYQLRADGLGNIYSLAHGIVYKISASGDVTQMWESGEDEGVITFTVDSSGIIYVPIEDGSEGKIIKITPTKRVSQLTTFVGPGEYGSYNIAVIDNGTVFAPIMTTNSITRIIQGGC